MEASLITVGGVQYRMKDSSVGSLAGLNTESKTIGGALQELSERCNQTGGSVEQIVCNDNGLYFTDGFGYVFMKYTPEEGLDVSKVSEELMDKLLVPASPLYNKKLYLFGNANNNWAKKLGAFYNMEIEDNSSNTESLSSQVSASASVNADGVYIIITMLDSNISGIDAGLAQLAKKYYSAKILLVLPFRKNNESTTAYDTLIADARRYSIGVYNSIDNSCVRAWDSNFVSAYMTSGGNDFTDNGSSFFIPAIGNYLKRY